MEKYVDNNHFMSDNASCYSTDKPENYCDNCERLVGEENIHTFVKAPEYNSVVDFWCLHCITEYRKDWEGE